MDVAQTASAAARDHHVLVARDKVGDQVAAGQVAHDRARRNVEGQVVAGLAVPPRTRAATAVVGLEMVPVAVVAKHRLARVDDQVDAPATAAVAAVGTAARHVGLASEGRRAVATVAGADGDRHLVKKHVR